MTNEPFEFEAKASIPKWVARFISILAFAGIGYGGFLTGLHSLDNLPGAHYRVCSEREYAMESEIIRWRQWAETQVRPYLEITELGEVWNTRPQYEGE